MHPQARMDWLKSTPLWLFVATVALFTLAPQIDLAVSALFQDPDGAFSVGHIFAVRVLHEGWDYAARATAVALALYIGASYLFKRLAARGRRRAAAFLLLTLLIGPGLIVNSLKDTWGRARPMTVAELGGDKLFTPALVPSDQCDRNCAFTSGHAAFGFWWLALAFVDRRRRAMWLAIGITLGLGIGLVRIAQGGHFLSDVLFSGWIVYATAVGLSVLVLKRRRRVRRAHGRQLRTGPLPAQKSRGEVSEVEQTRHLSDANGHAISQAETVDAVRGYEADDEVGDRNQ